MRVIIITYPTPKDIQGLISIKADDYVIAVDQAVQYVIEQQMTFDLAVGDFDSLKDDQVLEGHPHERLSSIKDVTDTEYALDRAILMSPTKIYIIGGMEGGHRIEHFFAHTFLFKKYPNLIMMDEHTTIRHLGPGVHQTSHKGYISLFAYPQATISLEGFKYDLDAYVLETYDPLCISNELEQATGWIEVHEGDVLIFESKKEKK